MLPMDQPDFRAFLQIGGGEKQQVKHVPNWGDVELKLERDKTAHDIIFQFSSNKMRFFGEDCHIIRKALYEIGFNADLRFYLEMLDRDEKTPSPTLWKYVPLFTGVVNMLSIDDEHITDERGAEFIDLQVIEDGDIVRFLNNDDHDYEIKPYEDGTTLSYDRLIVNNTAAYSVTGLIDYPLGDWQIDNNPNTLNGSLYITPKLSLGGKEDTAKLVQFKDVNQSEDIYYTNQGSFPFSGRNFLTVPSGIALNAKIKLKGNLTFSQSGGVIVSVYILGNTTKPLSSATFTGDNVVFYFDVNRDVDMSGLYQPTLYISIYPLSDNASITNLKLTLEESPDYKNVEVSYLGKNPKSRTVNTCFTEIFIEKLASKAAELPITVDSGAVGFELTRSVITGANGIRNMADATAKMNINDFMKSLQRIFGFGWHYRSDGAMGYVELRPVGDFYQKDTMIADVGQAFNLQVAAIDNVYSEVQVGYDKTGDDEVNDIYEFNCKNTFGVASKFTEKSLDLVSKLRADMYGFENQVREIMDEDKSTTARKDEGDLWILDINNEIPLTLRRDRGAYEGSPAGESLFNLFYSPKHMLSRNAGLVAAATYPKPNLTYNSSERSSDLQSMVGGIVQPELGDMDMSQYKPYFLPFSFLFYTHYDVQLIAKLKANPYGYIQFHWEGLTMRGFIYPDVVVFPGPKKEVKWQLVAHPDSNMQEILSKYDAAGRLKSLWR